MERKATYQPTQVLPHVVHKHPKNTTAGEGRARMVDFDGDLIRMDSLRYQTFAKSLQCVECKVEGQFFAKERQVRIKSKECRFHLNLYAIVDGKDVLMTKDHITPKSKGGKDHIDNLQTMCCICNWTKGDKLP